jgi:hypothetical protein
LTYYYYRASSIEFGQVPLAIYTETSTERRVANAEKTQEQQNGERWQNWKIEMANRQILSIATGFGRGGESEFASSLGSSSKVVEVRSKVVEVLEVLVPVCDMCRELELIVVVPVNGRGDRICSEGIRFALLSRT